MQTLCFILVPASVNAAIYLPLGQSHAKRQREACRESASTSGMTAGEALAHIDKAAALGPMPGGCDDCIHTATMPEEYCMSQGTDCDGMTGYNESYLYERFKYTYRCPDGNNYVACSSWNQFHCCNNGKGMPLPWCVYPGHITCK